MILLNLLEHLITQQVCHAHNDNLSNWDCFMCNTFSAGQSFSICIGFCLYSWHILHAMVWSCASWTDMHTILWGLIDWLHCLHLGTYRIPTEEKGMFYPIFIPWPLKFTWKALWIRRVPLLFHSLSLSSLVLYNSFSYDPRSQGWGLATPDAQEGTGSWRYRVGHDWIWIIVILLQQCLFLC